MNAILGFSSLLSVPNLTECKKQEYIEIINKSGNHLLNIINDIISIASLESGNETINASETNLNDTIKNAISQTKQLKSSDIVRLKIKLGLVDNDSNVITDSTKLSQILINLISNALKFTKRGEVSVSYIVIDEKIIFEIKDTGIGIKEEQLDLIFERFRQADNINPVSHGGTGLGLAITRSYVELLGGKICVESKLNLGTKFTFEIPYIKIESNSENKVIVNNRENNRQLKVLICEDNFTNYQL